MSTAIRVPGARLTERAHTVRLDHSRPDGPTITVFTREVADPEGGADGAWVLDRLIDLARGNA